MAYEAKNTIWCTHWILAGTRQILKEDQMIPATAITKPNAALPQQNLSVVSESSKWAVTWQFHSGSGDNSHPQGTNISKNFTFRPAFILAVPTPVFCYHGPPFWIHITGSVLLFLCIHSEPNSYEDVQSFAFHGTSEVKKDCVFKIPEYC